MGAHPASAYRAGLVAGGGTACAAGAVVAAGAVGVGIGAGGAVGAGAAGAVVGAAGDVVVPVVAGFVSGTLCCVASALRSFSS